MQLSAKTQNALLATLELAKHHEQPDPVSLKSIAEAQQISSQFLVQILLQLKRSGIVQSTRGSGGGYRLSMPPSQVSLLDVVVAMEGTPDAPTSSGTPASRMLVEIWTSLQQEHFDRLASITLDDMSDQVRSSDMYYI